MASFKFRSRQVGDPTVQQNFDQLEGVLTTDEANLAAAQASITALQAQLGGLRIVRGGVTGTTGASSGTGFTSVRNAAGDYTLTFSPVFAALPALVAMVGGTGSATTVKTFGGSVPSASTWRLATLTDVPALVDSDFFFIVVGP